MELFEHSEKLTRIFRGWPSFHDAEVVRLILDRTGSEAPSLEAWIHVFQATSEVDSAGHYVLKNHTLVTLTFKGVALEQLQWFNQQNVLSSLEVSSIDPADHEGRRIRVEMPSLYGVEARFECKRAIVTDAKIYESAV